MKSDEMLKCLNQAVNRLQAVGATSDEIGAVYDAIDELNTRHTGDWIAVKDRLPEDGKAVLISNRKWVCEGYYQIYEARSARWENDEGLEIKGVTHWRELPQPPMGKGDE